MWKVINKLFARPTNITVTTWLNSPAASLPWKLPPGHHYSETQTSTNHFLIGHVIFIRRLECSLELTFLHRTTATAAQVHQQVVCRSTPDLPVQQCCNSLSMYDTNMLLTWPWKEPQQILEIHEGWVGGRGSTTLQSLIQLPDPVFKTQVN